MKKGKKLLISLLAIIFILATGYGLIMFILIWRSSTEKPVADTDTIIILGAQVKGTTKGNAYPTQSLKERLDTAFAYWKEHSNMTVIVSGGQGSDEPDTEANVMADYLIDKGLPENQIIRETKSTSTYENLIYSNKLKPLNNAVVVTNDYHIYRAKLLGKRLGIQLQGLSAPTRNSSKYFGWLREVLALGHAMIFK